ncbi:MAG TPA: hypothetical protein PKK26_16900 [Candidatus Wallbacteria bacterium]|nr:hypothetical protein [Candidatus Wallbacteria bacterium]
MRKVSFIVFTVVLTMAVALFMVNPKSAGALESEEMLGANVLMRPYAEDIKGLTVSLYRDIKNDADDKLWRHAIEAVDWFVHTFVGESPEIIKEGLETYLISNEALDSFVAVASMKIDRAIRDYIADNSRRVDETFEVGVENYSQELRRAVDVAAAINGIYSGLKTSTRDDGELLKHYYDFRKQHPELDPPLELFLLVGETIRAFVKPDSCEYSVALEVMKAFLSFEGRYQAEQSAFKSTLTAGIKQMRACFNERLQILLDTIAKRLTQY